MSKDNQTSPAIQPVSTVTATPATETTPAVAAASSSAAKAETETSPQDTVEISPDAAKDSKATTSGGTAGTSETQDSKTAQDSKKTEEPKETEDPEKKKAQQEEELKAIEKKIEDLKQKVLEDAKKGDTKALEDDLNQLEGLEQERQALINALQPQTSAPQAVPAASSAPAAASSPAARGAPAAMASPISAQP